MTSMHSTLTWFLHKLPADACNYKLFEIKDYNDDLTSISLEWQHQVVVDIDDEGIGYAVMNHETNRWEAGEKDVLPFMVSELPTDLLNAVKRGEQDGPTKVTQGRVVPAPQLYQ